MRSRSFQPSIRPLSHLLSGALVLAFALGSLFALPSAIGPAHGSDFRLNDLRGSDRDHGRSDAHRRHKPSYSQFRDGRGTTHQHHYRSDRDAQRGWRHDHRRQSVVIGGDLPTHVPGIGTYSGGLSAFRDRGNGVYLYREGGRSAEREPFRLQDGPRIVVPGGGDAQCSNESGVCVIRPGY
jgi:hypothetical protein